MEQQIYSLRNVPLLPQDRPDSTPSLPDSLEESSQQSTSSFTIQSLPTISPDGISQSPLPLCLSANPEFLGRPDIDPRSRTVGSFETPPLARILNINDILQNFLTPLGTWSNNALIGMAPISDNRNVIVLPTCLVTSFLLAASLSAYTYSTLRKELLRATLDLRLSVVCAAQDELPSELQHRNASPSRAIRMKVLYQDICFFAFKIDETPIYSTHSLGQLKRIFKFLQRCKDFLAVASRNLGRQDVINETDLSDYDDEEQEKAALRRIGFFPPNST